MTDRDTLNHHAQHAHTAEQRAAADDLLRHGLGTVSPELMRALDGHLDLDRMPQYRADEYEDAQISWPAVAGLLAAVVLLLSFWSWLIFSVVPRVIATIADPLSGMPW